MIGTRIVHGELHVYEYEPKFRAELTERELDVLVPLAHGKPTKVIAYELGVPFDTVRSRLKRIYRKLDAQNSVQAVLAAHRLGVVDLEAAAEAVAA